MHEFSFFRNITETKKNTVITVEQMVNIISSTDYAREIAKIRETYNTQGKEAANMLKRNLPAVVLAGKMTERKKGAITAYSGLIQIDIDGIGQDRAELVRDILRNDQYIVFVAISPSGNGVKAAVSYQVTERDNDKNYLLCAERAMIYFKRRYQLKLDAITRTAEQPCYITHDPNCHYNQRAEPMPAWELYVFTELGNRDRFTADWRGAFTWNKSRGWLAWNNGVWTSNQAHTINAGSDTVRGIWDEITSYEILSNNGAQKKLDTDKLAELRKEVLRHWKKSESATQINAMINLSQPKFFIDNDKFDQFHDLVNVKNGVISTVTGKIEPHNPNYYMTRQSDIIFDQKATCPLWLNFLGQVFNNDKSLIEYIQTAIGYSLTGKTTEQVFFFLYGTGKNGKSVFCNILERLCGDYTVRMASDSLMLRYQTQAASSDIARLAGARIAIASEVSESARLNEGLVKDLTGNDKITARFQRENEFEFRPQLKLWMYGNHKPIIPSGGDFSIFRRVRLIPFLVTFEKQDKELTEKLMREINGIFNWAIEGAQKWQQHGLPQCKVIDDATEEYKNEQDTLKTWAEECTVKGKEMRTSFKAIMQSYKEWCTVYGYYQQNPKRVAMWLQQNGYKKGRVGNDAGYLGIGIPNKAPEIIL